MRTKKGKKPMRTGEETERLDLKSDKRNSFIEKEEYCSKWRGERGKGEGMDMEG